MSLSSNSEKEVSSYSSEVLEDVSKHAKDVLEILNRETNRVRKEMETLDEAGKKHVHVHFTDNSTVFFSECHHTLPLNAFVFYHGEVSMHVDICTFASRGNPSPEIQFNHTLVYLIRGWFVGGVIIVSGPSSPG